MAVQSRGILLLLVVVALGVNCHPSTMPTLTKRALAMISNRHKRDFGGRYMMVVFMRNFTNGSM